MRICMHVGIISLCANRCGDHGLVVACLAGLTCMHMRAAGTRHVCVHICVCVTCPGVTIFVNPYQEMEDAEKAEAEAASKAEALKLATITRTGEGQVS